MEYGNQNCGQHAGIVVPSTILQIYCRYTYYFTPVLDLKPLIMSVSTQYLLLWRDLLMSHESELIWYWFFVQLLATLLYTPVCWQKVWSIHENEHNYYHGNQSSSTMDIPSYLLHIWTQQRAMDNKTACISHMYVRTKDTRQFCLEFVHNRLLSAASPSAAVTWQCTFATIATKAMCWQITHNNYSCRPLAISMIKHTTRLMTWWS